MVHVISQKIIKSIWVEISDEQLQYFGVNIPLIAAEKIALKKVKVNIDREKVDLR